MSLSQSSYLVSEEDGQVTVQLVKSGQTQLPVEVLLSTVAATASGMTQHSLHHVPMHSSITEASLHEYLIRMLLSSFLQMES